MLQFIFNLLFLIIQISFSWFPAKIKQRDSFFIKMSKLLLQSVIFSANYNRCKLHFSNYYIYITFIQANDYFKSKTKILVFLTLFQLPSKSFTKIQLLSFTNELERKFLLIHDSSNYGYVQTNIYWYNLFVTLWRAIFAHCKKGGSRTSDYHKSIWTCYRSWKHCTLLSHAMYPIFHV